MEAILESGIFELAVPETRSFSELLLAGKYSSRCGEITEARFPLDASARQYREIVLLNLSRSDMVSTRRVLAEAERIGGIVRPTVADCLRFGADHPSYHQLFPLVFLHEPAPSPSGPEILCLGGSSGYRSRSNPGGQERRTIACYWFDTHWSPIYRFVFVKVPKTPPPVR